MSELQMSPDVISETWSPCTTNALKRSFLVRLQLLQPEPVEPPRPDGLDRRVVKGDKVQLSLSTKDCVS